jgi:hypothetical protein
MPDFSRHQERGNIFFTLFGAVALVGVIGAATTTLMRGPLATVATVNARTKADAQMQIASKLAMIAASQQPLGGNCDADVFIEPVPPVVATPVPVGGGGLPPTIGAAQNDPWGTPYGYCTWDLGVETGEAGCGGAGARLAGGDNALMPIMVILSAGPDREYQTECEAWADNMGTPSAAPPSNSSTLINKPPTSDDLLISFTYDEAVSAADGLWSIKSADPGTITTAKNVEFASGTTATFQGTARFDPFSELNLSAASKFMIPTTATPPACNVANDAALIIDTSSGGNVLSICSEISAGVWAWDPIGGGGATVSSIDDLDDAAASAGDDVLFLGEGTGILYSSAIGGINNIGIGIDTVPALTSGDKNIVIGNGAASSLTTGTGNIVIGHGIDIAAAASDTLRIGAMIFGTGMYSSGGQIGIGGAPSVMFDVAGPAEATQFQFDSNTHITGPSGTLAFATGNTTRVTINDTGLGVGLVPDAPLDVNGNAEISGHISADRFMAYASGSGAGNPAFTFVADNDTGIFHAGADQLGFSLGGATEATLTTTALTVGGAGLFSGEVRGDSFDFNASNNSGLFYASGSGVNLNVNGATSLFADTSGNIGIGLASPAVKLDVGGPIRVGTTAASCGASLYGAVRYSSGDVLSICSSVTGDWETIGTSGGGGGGGGGLWTNNTTYITRGSAHVVDNAVPLPAALEGAGTRLVWYPNKAVFRAGSVTGTQWDDANIGGNSTAFGLDAIASASNSFSAGSVTAAGGTSSVALGNQATASGANSFAFGLGATAGTPPEVSAAKSLGIFMGDQGGVNLNASNIMLLAGGSLVIDPDQTAAGNIALSRAGLAIDAEGDIAATEYCDKDGNNCFTATDIAAGATGSPGNDRELIFNSSGALWTDTGLVFTSSGYFGIGTAAPQAQLDVAGTGALITPRGDTAQRPAGVNGMLRYNSTNGKFEGFQAGAWQDILTGAASMNAAGADREIQFNSNGVLEASPTYKLMADGDLLLTGTHTGVASVPVVGAGTRMFFDVQRSAFRAGSVTGARWNNADLGDYSAAMGFDTKASGQYSTALGSNTTASGSSSVAGGFSSTASGQFSTAFGFGSTASGANSFAVGSSAIASGIDSIAMGSAASAYGANGVAIGFGSIASGISSLAMGTRVLAGDGTAGNGLGDGSFALGLIDDAVPIGAYPQVQGIQSMGVFMGNQNGLILGDNNTVGFFGGKMVIDPAAPATQLSARSVLDLGAATDAIVLPSGTTGQQPASPVNGMLRYNSTNGKFEGYQGGAWQDILTGAAAINAAGADREIQFNSAGSFGASPAFKLMADGDLLLTGTDTGTASVPATGAGTRMFFDIQKSAFRAGAVDGAQWDNANIGGASVAMGWDNIASWAGSVSLGLNNTSGGTASIALGSANTATGTGASGSTAIGYNNYSMGDGSIALGAGNAANDHGAYAIGLGNVAGINSFAMGFSAESSGTKSVSIGMGSPAGAKPKTSGTNSLGLFMGDQSAVDFAANTTMGLFGGKLVIDPAVPATQLVARGVLDAGAATDAIVLPSGTTGQQPASPVNGMLRYNSTNGKFEGYQAGAWKDIVTGAAVVNAAGADREIQFNSGGDFSASSAYKLMADGDLLLTGTFSGTASVPATGAGTRMFFDTQKAAFRAGAVSGTQWDNAGIGDYSVAMGNSAKAQGGNSVAMGAGTTALGGSSVAMGNTTTANANYAIAMGQDITASGVNSVAFGLGDSTGTLPLVSGARSFGVFMGDRDSENLTGSDTIGVLGGKMLIVPSPAGSYAAPSAALEVNGGDFLVGTTVAVGAASAPATGAGTRMFFDVDRAAFRAGYVGGTQWDNANLGGFSTALGANVTALGQYSLATGESTSSSGQFSMAMGRSTSSSGIYSMALGSRVTAGNGTAGSGFGDGSLALGLIDDAVTITANSQVKGIQSLGIFMGDQDGLVMSADSTMGLFGGKMVIDPAVPATQLTARGVIDVGAATDAIVVPRGTDAQRPGTPAGGMVRYNTDATPNDKVEYYDAESAAWVQLGGGGSAALSGITAATATNTIDSLNFAQTWNWSTLSTQTAMAMNANALTSGKMLALGSTATAFTGTMADLTLSGNNAANTGTVLKSTVSGASSAAVPIMATNNGTGLSLRINDDGTDTDSTPVVVDASGKLVIGATTARGILDANGGDFIVSGTYSGTASVPVAGAGTRMAFDADTGSFRAGGVGGAAWDNSVTGIYSVAMGLDTRASGDYSVAAGVGSLATGNNSLAVGYGAIATGGSSVALGDTSTASGLRSTAMGYTTIAAGDHSAAFGNQVNISATGDGSAAFGLTTASPATDPIVSGAQSFALFMGNHSAVNFAAANTMGLFGGKLVIDPAVPATQLTARGVIDAGAATDAIVFPRGTDAQRPGTPAGGMVRYNTDATPNDKIEYYDAESAAWVQVGTGGIATNFAAGLVGTPGLYVTGDANTGLWQSGADTLNIAAGGVEAMRFNTAASAVNYFAVTPAAAGSSPILSAVGASANIGMTLTPKGTGGVTLTSGNLVLSSGDISYTGVITDTSDMRLKKDIHPLRDRGSMLDKLGQLDTYSFTMKNDPKEQVEFGVMAQDIQKIFPELVRTDMSTPEHYMSVNYIGMIAPLIEAGKELKAENDDLKARLASLEQDMKGMKAQTGYGIEKASVQLWMIALASALFGASSMIFLIGGILRSRREENHRS